MIAAVYARKSTDQNGADAEARSVARQVESAREFAAARGWTVPDEFFVGYGLDHAGRYRGLPDLALL